MSKVRVEEWWIPMPDGTRLRARAWRPAQIPEGGAPALLEYLPYRLDDWTWVRDSERHPYYAAHGYVSVRVDIRGTGSSQGHFIDEYSEVELDDGIEVINWLARQPWSNGRVGMFGISWGGFNSLQLAARAPEPLKAIVTVCSADDRYDNDVHYIGGALLGIDMSAWAGTMLAFASRPPRPEVVGADWVEQWADRLEHLEPLGPRWLAHQERDDYWRRGSVCEDYGAISAAVLAVGGWSDPYRDTVLRLVENLSAPVKGIIGPWSHQYPDRELAPGPAIGFLQETLRWWDQWLKDVDTGVLAEPDLRAWITASERPATYIEERSGRWAGVDWPARSGAHTLSRPLAAGDDTAEVIVDSPWNTGQDAGRYFPFGNTADLPPDQRAEDGRSVCIDFPVDSPTDLLGRVQVRLRLASSRPRANVIARLCDVAPDGSSTLVTLGVLNLCKRNGMDTCADLTPGEMQEVTVPLRAAGYRFPPGHRIRVAISNHYWPWVWPHEDPGALTLDLARSTLELPLVPAGEQPVEFPPPAVVHPIEITPPEGAPEPRPERVVSYDVATGETTLDVDPRYGGTRQYPDGLTFLEDAQETYRIAQGQGLSPQADTRWQITLRKPGWQAEIETSTSLTCEPGAFVYTATVRARAEVDGADDGADGLLFERSFRDVIPRTSV